MEQPGLSSQQYDNGASKITELTTEQLEEYLSSFPSGYRFEPMDHELIRDYLIPKINGEHLPRNLMHVVNIYKYNPEYLTAMYKAQGGKKWYFFTSRERKYRNGKRPNRKAGDGYWKATGADKDIKNDGKVVGHRKALVFYEGRPPKGDKTPWIMHEFRIQDDPNDPSKSKKRKINSNDDTSMRLDDHVLCRIYKKEETDKDRNQLQQEVKVQEDAPVEDTFTDRLMQSSDIFASLYDQNTLPTMNIYSDSQHNSSTSHSDINSDYYRVNSNQDTLFRTRTYEYQQPYTSDDQPDCSLFLEPESVSLWSDDYGTSPWSSEGYKNLSIEKHSPHSHHGTLS